MVSPALLSSSTDEWATPQELFDKLNGAFHFTLDPCATRLKDKGFGFESWFGGTRDISFWIDVEIDEDIAKDLDLLFGGEE